MKKKKTDFEWREEKESDTPKAKQIENPRSLGATPYHVRIRHLLPHVIFSFFINFWCLFFMLIYYSHFLYIILFKVVRRNTNQPPRALYICKSTSLYNYTWFCKYYNKYVVSFSLSLFFFFELVVSFLMFTIICFIFSPFTVTRNLTYFC